MADENGANGAKPNLPDLRFTWQGRTYELAMSSLTFGEREELEEYVDQPWGIIMVSGWAGSYKVLKYLAYISVRRAGVDVKLEDFDALTEADIGVGDEGADDEDRPTAAAPDESSGPSSSSNGSASTPGTSTAPQSGTRQES